MRGRLGLTWTLFSLCPARASAHLLTTRKRAAVLPAAVVRLAGVARRMRTTSWRGCGCSAFSLLGKSEAAVFQISDGRSSCPFSLYWAIQRS